MKKKILKFLSYVLVAAIASGATFALTAHDEGYSKLEQLSDLIEEYFIGESDVTAMEDAAAEAMIDSLDDEWSYYISAADYSSYLDQMSNSYVGIGITVTQREDGYLDVMEVTAGGPAEAAGVLGGDIVTHADGQDLAELGIDGATALIKGKEGTAVTITVLRDGEALEFEITRAYFETVVASGVMVTDTIGLITIENFDERCKSESVAAIEELMAQGATALIFDVRNNPGGYKSELVDLLDYLLPEGDLFISEYYDGTTYTDTSDADCLEIPMVVLVNEYSYSAAEFFAAALSEYEAATVVGEQTYGKGYFQYTYQLNDGSAAALSVGKYYTPKGISLAGVGITPDVVVEVDEDTFAQIYYGNLDPSEDPQILAAIEVLNSGN